MNGLPVFDPRCHALKAPDPAGEGDDIPCVSCGVAALDTGLECTECGHGNYAAVYGHAFGEVAK